MNRIKELRIKRGLTQSELAQMLNIAQNTLSYWETGKTEPNGEALIKLADFFETTIDNLLGRKHTEQYKQRNQDKEIDKDPYIKAIARASQKLSPDKKLLLKQLAESMIEEAKKDADN